MMDQQSWVELKSNFYIHYVIILIFQQNLSIHMIIMVKYYQMDRGQECWVT